MEDVTCKHLTVRPLSVVDSKGEARIHLHADDDGSACIGLFGNNGVLINISTDPTGGCQVLLNKAGSTKLLVLHVSPEGEPVTSISKDGGPLKVVA